MPPISRRDLLVNALAASAGGLFLPIIGRAQPATPAASPVALAGDLLVSAADALNATSGTQWLAVLDAGEFESGHIDGSLRVNWDELQLSDTSEEGIAGWEDDMRALLSARGVSPHQEIVVYDAGSLFAARGWWQLAFLGFPAPRVLDGGLAAWREAGGEVTQGPDALHPLEAPHVDAGVRRDLLATKDEILAALGSGDVVIVDARSDREYNEGHIPGAVNVPYTDNAEMTDANVYLPADALRTRYEALGMEDGKRAITYCSTGARGSVASFALRVAGFTDVALYAGSWTEWSADSAAPVE